MTLDFLYISLTITALSLLILLFHYLVPYTAILRFARRERRHRTIFTTEQPKVSVIVVTRNSDVELESYMPLLLQQTYPDYEVILVDDGSWDETQDVVRNLQEIYPHLYVTKIPQQSRIYSRRKLAITVGAKAAHGDILLLTEPSARPFSQRWIETMVRNFTTGVEFVTGNCVVMDNGGFNQHLFAYDTLLRTMHATGFTAMGHPYTGSESNIAYLRSTFFANDGFAGMLHQRFGDGDLMINSHGNGLNTKVEPTLMAHTVCMDHPSHTLWRFMKRFELSTLGDYRFGSLVSIFTEPVFRTLYYIGLVVSALLLALTMPEWWMIGIYALAGSYLLKSFLLLLVVNLTATMYKQKRFWLSALFFDIYVPVATICIRLFTRLPKHNI